MKPYSKLLNREFILALRKNKMTMGEIAEKADCHPSVLSRKLRGVSLSYGDWTISRVADVIKFPHNKIYARL